MTPAEIVKALRCTTTPQTGDEPCASCPFNRVETLTEAQKAQLHCDEWHSCDIDGVALAAADLIKRLEKEKAERWIPATEPPKEWKDEKTGYMKNYLINCVYSGVDVGNYHALAGCWLCCGLPVKVTHWMPLPGAPEEGGKA